MLSEKESTAQEHNQSKENESTEKAALALSLKEMESQNEELKTQIEEIKNSLAQAKEGETQDKIASALLLKEVESQIEELRQESSALKQEKDSLTEGHRSQSESLTNQQVETALRME